MSDTPQGPDWWQASDDKWYPPPRPAMPGDGDPAAVAAPAMAPPGAPPPGAPPAGAPAGPPMAPPMGPPSGGFPSGPPSGGFAPPGPTSGPYGAPPGAPAPGGQNRTPLFIAIGVVVAAAVVGLVVLVSGGDGDDEPTAPTTEATAATDTTTEPAGNPPASSGGEEQPAGNADVQLVDSGFSNFMGGFDQDELSASYGFVVENTGDDTATDVRVSVSVFDAAGNVLTTNSHTIYVLRPGQTMGIGDEFWGGDLTAEVADVQIQISEPSGFEPDIPDEGVLTAEGVTTLEEQYGGLKTTFTVTSTYGQQIDGPYGYAIYKDASGNIVGGSYGILDFVPANGSTAGEIRSFETVPNVATTEVYIDPGYLG